jgi:hypothetical protein
MLTVFPCATDKNTHELSPPHIIPTFPSSCSYAAYGGVASRSPRGRTKFDPNPTEAVLICPSEYPKMTMSVTLRERGASRALRRAFENRTEFSTSLTSVDGIGRN